MASEQQPAPAFPGTTEIETDPGAPASSPVSTAAPEADGDHHPARLMSATPGRLRVRLGHRAGGEDAARRGDEEARTAVLRRVRDGLAGRTGVRDVQTNATTGSATIRYEPAGTSREDLLSLLYDLGLVVHEVASGEGAAGPEEGAVGTRRGAGHAGHSRTAAGLMGTLDDADRRLRRLTGRAVDLKLLFPAALGAVGLTQLARQGFGLAEIPAYVLLWYAFDSFFKLHKETGRAVRQAAAEGEARARPAADPARGGHSPGAGPPRGAPDGAPP